MKAAITKDFGFRSPLILAQSDKPEIAPNDVLVEVYTSSVNPKDWKLNQPFSSLLKTFGLVKKPLLIGDDLAGVVVEVGADVKGFRVGDEVYGMDMCLRTATCAEYARIDSSCIALKPKTLDFMKAGVVPLAGLTALQGLRIGEVKQGDKVLIIGASGGVGSFAVQIAKILGAHVSAVCSAKNADFVRSVGADVVIDYQQETLTDKKADFDFIFDVTSSYSLAALKDLIKVGGCHLTTGGNALALISYYRDKFLFKEKHAKAVWVSPNTKDLELLASYIDENKLIPVIDSQYDFEQINEAFLRNRSGRCVGKVAISIK